ncbi:ABC-type glycerol-3-phosphate transport system, substrate-binding protein [Paenibacillus catalpae]|uniref:ABC-type glycerol-3-phosphate transport system, substrate-binding protein n=1 Tax=Paenibacillus catalpae TaxID=1045775 RepID=A0A1I1TJC8_9BACL|nr:extracellular solute-binding protein [Paenibacillus catalpae]SFD58722.1 ABC-type glycerol-3-phosphate transport system, substrate-binding protein [Paenibacillus catalpae]
MIFAGAVLLSVILLIPNLDPHKPASTGSSSHDANAGPVVGDLDEEPAESIVVTVSMAPEEFAYLEEASERFRMRYPNIHVQLQNVESKEEAYTAWKQDLMLGSSSDIMLMDSGWVTEFAVMGLLEPVDSVNTANTVSDQPAKLLAPLKWNSYLWGIPYDADPSVLVWNKAMLADQNLNEPPKDWASFSELASHLTASGKASESLLYLPADFSGTAAWLDAWSSAEKRGAGYLLLNEESANRLKETASLTIPSASLNTLLLGTEMDNQRLLASVIPWSLYKGLSRTEQDKLEIDKSKIRNLWLGSRSFVVSANSDKIEAAFTWIKEMTSVTEQERNYVRFGKLPAKNSVYEISGYSGTTSQYPPSWWLPLLNEEPISEPPAPSWHKEWARWQALWKLYVTGATDITSFIGSVTASSSN